MSDTGHKTGMAGEFFVMEKLFRLGHTPALTLGYAKTIDIVSFKHKTMADSPTKQVQISVKAIRGGGKWGVGKTDYSLSQYDDLFFVLLHYRNFAKYDEPPISYIVPAKEIERRKKPWLNGSFAVYCGNEPNRQEIEEFKEKWENLN